MHLFNESFFKFVSGFICMIAVGLLWIVIIGHLTVDNIEETATITDNIENSPG